VLSRLSALLLAEAHSWAQEPSAARGLGLGALLELAEACVACGALDAEAGTAGVPLAQLAASCRQAFMRLTGISAPVVQAYLRLLHRLTERHSEWAALLLDPAEDASEPASLGAALVALLTLADAGAGDGADIGDESCGSGPSRGGAALGAVAAKACARLALGVLANAAAHSPVARKELAALRVGPGFTTRLIGSLAASGAGEDTAEPAEVPQLGDEAGETLLEALAVAFAARRGELFEEEALGAGPGAEAPAKAPARLTPHHAEVRVRGSAVAVLLGWLMHGNGAARALVVRLLGSTEVLVDVVRQFAVFQDRCGTLTDGSLVGLHTVMLSMEGAGDEACAGASGEGVTATQAQERGGESAARPEAGAGAAHRLLSALDGLSAPLERAEEAAALGGPAGAVTRYGRRRTSPGDGLLDRDQ